MTTTTMSAGPATSTNAGGRWFLGVLALWGAVVLILSVTGLTAALPAPLVPLPVVLGMAAILGAYAASPRVRALLQGVDIRHLTTFNVWRIPAALIFFWYGANHALPALFVRNAAWGDLIAGALAPLVPWLFPAGARHRRAGYLAFHLLSFADFALAVGTGLWISPADNPLMGNLRQFPAALIVFWGVPVTGALSLIALHRLLRGRNLGAAS